jgi:hypothetical protein
MKVRYNSNILLQDISTDILVLIKMLVRQEYTSKNKNAISHEYNDVNYAHEHNIR